MSIISNLYHKVVPKDATKWTLSTGDFGINCILGAVLIYLWPHPLMVLCACFIWGATMGISYRIPKFARDCARVGGTISHVVLWLAMCCSIGLSTTGLNMVSKLAISFGSQRGIDTSTLASFDIGFFVIPGDMAITWMMFAFSVVMSVCNGLGSYMEEKSILRGTTSEEKSPLRSVA